MFELFAAATFISVVGMMVILRRRIDEDGQKFPLRKILAFQALRRQVGMALESGYPPLFALGRGSLHTTAGPASIAGLQVLEQLVEAGGRGHVAPRVMLGAATLLPIAQDNVRRSIEGSAETSTEGDGVHFIADDSFPFTYGAGTANAIERDGVISSIAVGRFGPELAIIGEAANRRGVEQLMGSDDPSAIAIAVANTENSLWGEELFAAGAYLRQRSWDIAAIRTQDLLRWIVIVALLGMALAQVLGLT